jgi:NADH-quinone oxidoreductase subunit C
MVDKAQFLKEMGEKIGQPIDKKGRLYFEVAEGNLHEVVRYLFKTMGCRLSTATGMEMYHGLEILYHFSHDETGQYYCPRVVIKDKKNPRTLSITPIVRGAEWIEREITELLGIEFEGHPRPIPLLTRNHPKSPHHPLRARRPS